jgi:hypothetical protein
MDNHVYDDAALLFKTSFPYGADNHDHTQGHNHTRGRAISMSEHTMPVSETFFVNLLFYSNKSVHTHTHKESSSYEFTYAEVPQRTQRRHRVTQRQSSSAGNCQFSIVNCQLFTLFPADFRRFTQNTAEITQRRHSAIILRRQLSIINYQLSIVYIYLYCISFTPFSDDLSLGKGFFITLKTKNMTPISKTIVLVMQRLFTFVRAKSKFLALRRSSLPKADCSYIVFQFFSLIYKIPKNEYYRIFLESMA